MPVAMVDRRLVAARLVFRLIRQPATDAPPNAVGREKLLAEGERMAPCLTMPIEGPRG